MLVVGRWSLVVGLLVDGGWVVGWQDAADGGAVARRVLGSRHGRRSEFRPRAKSPVGNWRFKSRQDGGSPCGGPLGERALPGWRRWRNGCDPRAAATRKMRVVPVRRVWRPRPKHPRQARPLPREGARGVREAAREDARPPRVGHYFPRRLSLGFGPNTQLPFLVEPSCRRPSSLRSTFTW